MKNNQKILHLAQFSILLAIEAIVCFTPLGSLPVGPLVATLAHIPVLITAVCMGTAAGSLMGFFCGLFSFIWWTLNPGVMGFVFTPFYAPGNFWSLVICFVPRILIGTLAGLVFSAFRKVAEKNPVADVARYVVAGIVGTLANTVLVLGGIYLFFGKPYAEANGVAFEALLGILCTVVLTNGILEVILGALCTLAVGKAVNRLATRRAG
mgnify:FL=1